MLLVSNFILDFYSQDCSVRANKSGTQLQQFCARVAFHACVSGTEIDSKAWKRRSPNLPSVTPRYAGRSFLLHIFFPTYANDFCESLIKTDKSIKTSHPLR